MPNAIEPDSPGNCPFNSGTPVGSHFIPELLLNSGGTTPEGIPYSTPPPNSPGSSSFNSGLASGELASRVSLYFETVEWLQALWNLLDNEPLTL